MWTAQQVQVLWTVFPVTIQNVDPAVFRDNQIKDHIPDVFIGVPSGPQLNAIKGVNRKKLIWSFLSGMKKEGWL
jgi:hypothetical protein